MFCSFLSSIPDGSGLFGVFTELHYDEILTKKSLQILGSRTTSIGVCMGATQLSLGGKKCCGGSCCTKSPKGSLRRVGSTTPRGGRRVMRPPSVRAVSAKASACSAAAAASCAAPGPGRPGCGLGGCMRRGHRLRRERDGAAASRSDLAASAEASLQSRFAAACMRPVHTPRASLQSLQGLQSLQSLQTVLYRVQASLQSWSAADSPAAASPKLTSTMKSQAVVATRLASAMESGAPVAWGRAKDGARSGGAATWASGSLSSQSKRAWPSQSKPARRSESVEACVAVPAGARR